METMEGNKIAEGNKIIMGFDGWEKKTHYTFDPDNNKQNPGKNDYEVWVKWPGAVVRTEDIEFDIVYHQSWDALIKVIKKIDELQLNESYSRGDIFDSLLMLDLQRTWQAVVKFLQQLITHSTPNQGRGK